MVHHHGKFWRNWWWWLMTETNASLSATAFFHGKERHDDDVMTMTADCAGCHCSFPSARNMCQHFGKFNMFDLIDSCQAPGGQMTHTRSTLGQHSVITLSATRVMAYYNNSRRHWAIQIHVFWEFMASEIELKNFDWKIIKFTHFSVIWDHFHEFWWPMWGVFGARAIDEQTN